MHFDFYPIDRNKAVLVVHFQPHCSIILVDNLPLLVIVVFIWFKN